MAEGKCTLLPTWKLSSIPHPAVCTLTSTSESRGTQIIMWNDVKINVNRREVGAFLWSLHNCSLLLRFPETKAWQLLPIISALRRQKQKDREFREVPSKLVSENNTKQKQTSGFAITNTHPAKNNSEVYWSFLICTWLKYPEWMEKFWKLEKAIMWLLRPWGDESGKYLHCTENNAPQQWP